MIPSDTSYIFLNTTLQGFSHKTGYLTPMEPIFWLNPGQRNLACINRKNPGTLQCVSQPVFQKNTKKQTGFHLNR